MNVLFTQGCLFIEGKSKPLYHHTPVLQNKTLTSSLSHNSRSKVAVKAVTTVNTSDLTTIADEKTKVDIDEMAEEEAKDIYYDMKLGREFEEMCA